MRLRAGRWGERTTPARPPGFATTAEAYGELLAVRAHAAGRQVGLCGQRPSDDPAFTAILIDAGLDSVSVAPDSFASVKRHVARAEETRGIGAGRREE
ncbi:putative PEP-binding protein [Streptomyces sp. NPDC101115]|uniref:putative PEP-binding protein n=1 Tax=Streptomyces sp. NPDC101115 TaxID=3366106 RepID=UPI0037FD0590